MVVPTREISLLLLFTTGYLLQLFMNPMNATLNSFVQVFAVSLTILFGFQVMRTEADYECWYQVFSWNVIALSFFGWVEKGSGLLESVFNYANIMAALLLMTLIIETYFWRNQTTGRWIHVVKFTFLLVSLFATGARISWGLCLLGMLLLMIISKNQGSGWRWRWWIGVFVFILSGLLGLAFTSNTLWTELTQLSSLRLRFTYSWDALRLALEHPWLGVGAEGWSKQQYRYQTAIYTVQHIHNHFLQVWLEGGVLGLSAWVTFLGVMVRDFLRISRLKNKQTSKFFIHIWVATVCVVLYSFLDFILSYSALLMYLFFYLIVRRVVQEKKQDYIQSSKSVKAILITSLFVFIVGNCIGLYREVHIIQALQAVTMGQLRTALQVENTPDWVIGKEVKYLVLGKAYTEKAKRTNQQEDWKRSHDTLLKGIQSDPDDTRYYPPLIYTTYQQKQYEESVVYSRKLIELQPAIEKNYEQYGYALLMAGYDDQIILIPDLLAKKKEVILENALFKDHIPRLKASDRLQQIIRKANQKLVNPS